MENIGITALNLLKEMHESYKTSKNKEIQSDKIAYTSVMDALVRSNYPHFAKKSNKLLNEMHHLCNSGNYKLSQRLKIKPCVQTYNAVLHTIARTCDKKAGAKARRLVNEMCKYSILYHEEDMKPNLVTLNMFMDCYVKSKMTVAGTKCEGILREMVDGGKSDYILWHIFCN